MHEYLNIYSTQIDVTGKRTISYLVHHYKYLFWKLKNQL